MTEERFNELVAKYGYEGAKSLRDIVDVAKKQEGIRIAEMINDGTRKIVGDDYKPTTTPLEIPQTSKEECKAIADFINKGTIDILKCPTMETRIALERGQAIRDLQAKIKSE